MKDVKASQRLLHVLLFGALFEEDMVTMRCTYCSD